MRYFFLIITFVFILSNVFAQVNQDKLFISFQGGYFGSNVTNAKSPLVTYNYTTEGIKSFTYGLAIRYRILKHTYAVIGLKKNTFGTKVNYKHSVSTDDYSFFSVNEFILNLKNEYVSVPVFVEVRSAGKIKFFGQMGCYVSFLTHTKSVKFEEYVDFYYGLSRDVFIKETTLTEKKTTTNVDLDFLFGGGIACPITDKITVEINPCILVGLRKLDALHNNNSIITPDGAQIGDYAGLNSNARNEAFSLSVGLNYRIF